MKYVTPVRLFIGAGVLVSGVWFASVRGWTGLGMDQLECLFTGLGFVGLVAAFMHEHSQTEAADAEHRDLIQKMQEQTEAQQRLISTHALIARIEAYESQIEERRRASDFQRVGALRQEQHKLLEALDKLRPPLC